MTVKIHLLDVGKAEYGDAVLCRFDDRSVLIDGAHPGNQESKDGHTSIPAQLSRLLDQQNPPYRVDLLVVTHGHQDHIGCLPFLVEHDLLEARFALVADPDFAWGRTGGPDVGPVPPSDAVRRLVAALREEPLSVRSDDDAIAELIADSGDLESRYRGMIER